MRRATGTGHQLITRTRTVTEVEAPLAGWESYYVIVGTSAAALTGLTFVVITLLADEGPRSSDEHGIAAFITPTIFHFCVALLVSALLSAPWHGMSGLAAALGITALSGLGYAVTVLLRSLRVRSYRLVLEDWMWHAAFPFVAYAALAAAAILLRDRTVLALFIVGAVALLLVFVGIHNAWDTVTYVVANRLAREREREKAQQRAGDEGAGQ
jgi:hypothetical protein